MRRALARVAWRTFSPVLNVSLSAQDVLKGRMYTLFHHPFCPLSRFIRLVLGEYGLGYAFVRSPDGPGILAYGPGQFQSGFQTIT